MREYESEQQFRSVLEHPHLEFDVVRSNQLKFPLTDLAFRVAALAHLIKRERLPEIYLSLPRWVCRRAARDWRPDPRLPLGRGDRPHVTDRSETWFDAPCLARRTCTTWACARRSRLQPVTPDSYLGQARSACGHEEVGEVPDARFAASRKACCSGAGRARSERLRFSSSRTTSRRT